jgi:phosphohistidine phosphatase
MNIYLLRHGIAANADAVPKNGERPLTAKGNKRMRKAARGMRRLGLSFDAILTSPLPRARQTADIVAEALGLQSHTSVVEKLQPGNSPDDVLSTLSEYKGSEHLLLVGHEPLLSDTAAVLLTGKKSAAVELAFKKGSLCRIEVDSLPPREPAALHYLLAPKHLRLIGGRGAGS